MAERSYFEPRFGHDFSAVRVHTDAPAAASAQAVSARAYTVGNHIAFAPHAYAPGSREGRQLIAHELAHVVQQAGTASTPATALTVGESGAPQEEEADRLAEAVVNGQLARPAVRPGAGVARQDAGPAPDAGPSLTPDAGGTPAPDGGTTPAGGAGPTGGSGPSGGGGGGGGLGAPPPRILRVEVDNPRAAITYPVPSNLGAAGRQHWVTLAGTRPEVGYRAVLDPAVPAGDPSVSGLTWESNPAGALAPGGDVLHATTSVPTARKVVVRARLGTSTAELTLWAVFVSLDAGGVTMQPPTRRATELGLSGHVHFTGTVHPASLITDADRPALDGPNTIDPPGVGNVCGDALSGGADHRWDMSRQQRLANTDPAGLLPAIGAAVPPACLDTAVGFPAAVEEGNDDAATTDETNDPYAGGGVITSDDTPTRTYPDSVGADGDTIEQRLQFREFARLEFNRTWWKVSQFRPWRVHYRAVRTAGKWQDNGSDAQPDNAGF